MTMLCNQVLLGFLHCLKRTEHFLYQKNPADTEACLYELHQLQKTWRFSETYPNYFTMLRFVLPLSSMDICTHITLWYIRHPTAELENVMALSCLVLHAFLHAFLTVHLFPFLISILVFPSLKISIMSLTTCWTYLLYRMHFKGSRMILCLHTNYTAILPFVRFTAPLYLPVTSVSNHWNHPFKIPYQKLPETIGVSGH